MIESAVSTPKTPVYQQIVDGRIRFHACAVRE